MDDCIFCKIIRGDIPATKIYEDADVAAILDIQPANPGHCLILPKRHYSGLAETPDSELCAIFSAAKKAGQAAMRATGADAYNVIINNGQVAGQVIFHTHIHVIPRFPDDGHRHWQKKDVPEEKMMEVAAKMRQLLA
jgi:histidine triad (HIT) family protein